MKNLSQRFGQFWNYFKKGRNEISLLLGLYNLLLTYSIKFNVDFIIIQYLAFGVIFFIVCIFLGIFLAENIEPENSRISPYAQDNIKSTIHLQNSLLALYRGDTETAISEMNKAQKLREKWLR